VSEKEKETETIGGAAAAEAETGTVAAVPVLATRAPAGIATIAEAGAVVETEAGTIGVAPLAVGAEAGVQGTGVGKRVCRSV